MNPIFSYPTAELGSIVTIITRTKVRYLGRLDACDTEPFSISLRNVRCYGTENRDADPVIPESTLVYDNMFFEHSEILEVHIADVKLPDTGLTYMNSGNIMAVPPSSLVQSTPMQPMESMQPLQCISSPTLQPLLPLQAVQSTAAVPFQNNLFIGWPNADGFGQQMHGTSVSWIAGSQPWRNTCPLVLQQRPMWQYCNALFNTCIPMNMNISNGAFCDLPRYHQTIYRQPIFPVQEEQMQLNREAFENYGLSNNLNLPAISSAAFENRADGDGFDFTTSCANEADCKTMILNNEGKQLEALKTFDGSNVDNGAISDAAENSTDVLSAEMHKLQLNSNSCAMQAFESRKECNSYSPTSWNNVETAKNLDHPKLDHIESTKQTLLEDQKRAITEAYGKEKQT